MVFSVMLKVSLKCGEKSSGFLPVLTQEVFFPLAEGFDFLSLFVDLPLNDLSGFVFFVAEPVVTAGDRVIVPRVTTFKVEGANVASILDVVVVESTHARQVVEAVDFSFGELVFFIFHAYTIPRITEKARDFFTINETFFVDVFSNERFVLQVGTLLEQRIA